MPNFYVSKESVSFHESMPEDDEVHLSATWEAPYYLTLREGHTELKVSVLSLEVATGNSGSRKSQILWAESTHFPAPRLRQAVGELQHFRLRKKKDYETGFWHACRFGRSLDPGHTSVSFDALLLRNPEGRWFYVETNDVDYSS